MLNIIILFFLKLVEKTEEQQQKILEMTASINDLLKVRDGLLEEKKKLMEAKQSYHTHTNELNDRVQKLLVSL